MARTHRDTRPEGYYVESGTYPAMPPSHIADLSNEQLLDVVCGITPEVHAATMKQFSEIQPGE